MNYRLAHITLVVDDYEKAINFYTKKLDFELLADTFLSEEKRWVVVAPPGSSCSLLLAKASTEEQKTRIGNQTGGRVFLFLHTDDIQRDYKRLVANEIEIVRKPAEQPWGTVLVFKDVFGNLWDLIQPYA